MNERRTTKGILVALAAVFVMALVIPSLATASAEAAPVPLGTATASQQWAYGAQKWVNSSIELPNVTYSMHAFFGFAAVFTLTNTSATTFQLEAQRTAEASLSAVICVPNCTNSVDQANLTAKAWEKDTGFANFTTQAIVYENGTPVSAFGLENASASSEGNLSESLLVSALVNGVSHTLAGSLNVQGNANAQIAFAPSLGLIPWNVSANQVWNSSAAYTAEGAWSATYSAVRVLDGTTVSVSGTPSASVSGTGTVELYGADLGSITLGNGATVPVIALGVDGPFDAVDGVILVPHAFDLFGSADHPWDADAYGVAHLETARLDIAIDPLHHSVRIAAAAATASSVADGAATSPDAAIGSSPTATVTPNSAMIQAEPESVSAAQAQSACYTGTCASTPASNALLFVVLIGGVVALVIGSISVVEYRKWLSRRATQQAMPLPPPPSGATLGTPVPPPPPPPSLAEMPGTLPPRQP